MDIHQFIRQVPKAELHLHIEGSLEPELLFHLSKKNNIQIPFSSVESLKAAYQFENLQEFLNIYYQGAQVLQTEQDFYDLTWAYLEKAHQDNVIHTEIFFDPQTHTQRNIEFATVIKGIHRALTDGEEKLGMTSRLIMCFLRDLSEEDAMEILDMAAPFKDWIVGVGLDSAEVGHPPQKFQRVFEKAIAQGYLTVAHAGEEGPSSYIWDALKLLQVKRIDHGIRASDDPALIDYLKTNQIPLTVCPFSNVCLKSFKSIDEHNIIELLDHGLCVTVNSDDPAYFGGYVNDNFHALAKSFDLNTDHIAQLAKNSFVASFMPTKQKQQAIEKIEHLSLQAAQDSQQ